MKNNREHAFTSWIILGPMWIALTAGNLFFQACFNQDWSAAIERSFFQLVAFFTLWAACKFSKS